MNIKVNLDPLGSTSASIAYNNSDWLVQYQNMVKSRRRWGMVLIVLGKMGEIERESSILYKVVVQTVMLCGIEIWGITEAVMKVLEAFYHMIARRIMGKTARLID